MIEDDYRPTNREKSREPRGRAFWCDHCDHYKVWAQQKCWYCGHRSGKYREHPCRGNL